jgi:hypothetical protein
MAALAVTYSATHSFVVHTIASLQELAAEKAPAARAALLQQQRTYFFECSRF